MTGPEVTAAMNAEDVDAGLVEKAARALRDEQCTGHDHGTDACPDRHCRDDQTLPFYRARVRTALAAVLPEIQAQALRDAADEVSAYAWQPGDAPARVMPIEEQRAYMGGANDAHAIVDRLLRARAARLTTTKEPS